MKTAASPPVPLLNHSKLRSGVTVLELVVVLAILVAIAGLTVPLLSSTMETSSEQAAQASLGRIRDQVLQYWNDCGHLPAFTEDQRPIYLSDLLQQPDYLLTDPTAEFNPDTRLGWHGPYLVPTNNIYIINHDKNFTADYGADGDLAVIDPWGNPFVIQDVDPTISPGTLRDVRILSAGPDGVIDIHPSVPTSDLISGAVSTNDDVYLAITLR